MSIMGMVDNKLVEQIQQMQGAAPPGAPAAPAPAAAPAPQGVAANIVNQLVAWIPTESITLYVAYVALFDPLAPQAGGKTCDLNFGPRWIGFWVFVGLTALIAVGGYIGKRRTATPQPPFQFPLFAFLVAPVAFAAWAAALPDTPFADICSYRATYGGFAVLVTSVGIAFLAWMLGKSPDYIKSTA